jgi:hypothetical protein
MVTAAVQDHRVFKSGDCIGVFGGSAVGESGLEQQIGGLLRISAAGPGKTGTRFLEEVFKNIFCSDSFSEKNFVIHHTGIAMAHGMGSNIKSLVNTFYFVPRKFARAVTGIFVLPSGGEALFCLMESRIEVEGGFGIVLAAEFGKSDVIENSVVPALCYFDHDTFSL